jgi:magnesium chelatase subunit ChlI-like protein
VTDPVNQVADAFNLPRGELEWIAPDPEPAGDGAEPLPERLLPTEFLLAGPDVDQLPGQLHPRGRHEPVPVWLLGDGRWPCKRNPVLIERYLGKISWPLLDRMDLHIEVPAVPFQELAAGADGTSSAVTREQVQQAQRQRFGAASHRLNSRMSSRHLRKHCLLDAQGKALLKAAIEELGLSARAHDRILRVARTIADLEGAALIQRSVAKKGGKREKGDIQRSRTGNRCLSPEWALQDLNL